MPIRKNYTPYNDTPYRMENKMHHTAIKILLVILTIIGVLSIVGGVIAFFKK